MKSTRRALLAAGAAAAAAAQTASGVTRYARFTRAGKTGWGIVEGDSVRAIQGDLFGAHKPAGPAVKLAGVQLLAPADPPKVLAVGLNYKSHLGARTPPKVPEMFYKPVTCLTGPGAPIRIPKDSKNTHYEGELVIMIGRAASNVTEAEARNVIFGVTCGNDVSERDWQNGAEKDLQWWRAKGADTFGPCGPFLVRGIDYGKLRLRTLLNGQVVQEQMTSDLLFNCEQIVSFVSRYVALTPGDLIYTGTPGSTKKMNPGDVVEVEIEGIGTLKNPVV